MSSKSKQQRGEDPDFGEDVFDEESPVRRRRVDPEERDEYEEWRRERSGRGRKRRRSRDHDAGKDEGDS